jgi:hypothetical protein
MVAPIQEKLQSALSAETLTAIRHEASMGQRLAIPESTIGLRKMLAELLEDRDQLAYRVDRAVDLRKQAETTCVERTRDLEMVRSMSAQTATAREFGQAMLDLVAQLVRLRKVDCETRRFDWSATGMVLEIYKELNELEHERPRSPEAQAESIDVFAVSVQQMLTHNVELYTGIVVHTAKLKKRIDVVEAGGTWLGAKALEAATR